MKRPAATLLLAILPVYGISAEDMGRLFFTPEQRAQIERQHEQDITADEYAHAPTLSGIVQRNGGPRTVWINGVPQNSDGDGHAPDSETLPATGVPHPVKLKVGQRHLPEPESGR